MSGCIIATCVQKQAQSQVLVSTMAIIINIIVLQTITHGNFYLHDNFFNKMVMWHFPPKHAYLPSLVPRPSHCPVYDTCSMRNGRRRPQACSFDGRPIPSPSVCRHWCHSCVKIYQAFPSILHTASDQKHELILQRSLVNKKKFEIADIHMEKIAFETMDFLLFRPIKCSNIK